MNISNISSCSFGTVLKGVVLKAISKAKNISDLRRINELVKGQKYNDVCDIYGSIAVNYYVIKNCNDGSEEYSEFFDDACYMANMQYASVHPETAIEFENKENTYEIRDIISDILSNSIN